MDDKSKLLVEIESRLVGNGKITLHLMEGNILRLTSWTMRSVEHGSGMALTTADIKLNIIAEGAE